jgi:hypothetical protein
LFKNENEAFKDQTIAISPPSFAEESSPVKRRGSGGPVARNLVCVVFKQ